jgi:hypothetical protein
MVKSIIDELRAVAQRCVRLARECSNNDLSHALEELGVDLLAKASEIEGKFDR